MYSWSSDYQKLTREKNLRFDKDAIRKKTDEIAEALKVDGIKKEMDEIIDTITDYEKANFLSVMTKCPAYLKRVGEIDDMPGLILSSKSWLNLAKFIPNIFFRMIFLTGS